MLVYFFVAFCVEEKKYIKKNLFSLFRYPLFCWFFLCCGLKKKKMLAIKITVVHLFCVYCIFLGYGDPLQFFVSFWVMCPSQLPTVYLFIIFCVSQRSSHTSLPQITVTAAFSTVLAMCHRQCSLYVMGLFHVCQSHFRFNFFYSSRLAVYYLHTGRQF